MAASRRAFLLGAAAVPTAARLGRGTLSRPGPADPPPGFDPWVEVDPAALAANVRVVARYAGGRPILAVAKNNAYGLGLAEAGPVLDRAPEVSGLAVVRAGEARALRDAGVRKPILLMARCTVDEAVELVRREVRLSLFGDDAPGFCAEVGRRARRQVRAHLYLDTGMGRMGRRVDRADDWVDEVARAGVVLEGAFTELTEDPDFDREQVERLRAFASRAAARGVRVGPLHAASSAAVAHQPETHLDLVRPGFALYGGLVSREMAERAELRPAFRLRARVARVERLEAGDGVSYHRRWRAERPTWVATLPIGYVDGYPAEAVKGCEALIGGRLCPVVGTVTASHTVVVLGDEPTARVGDVATLMGPDHPAIHPDTVARRSGTSEYGAYFRLSPLLPRLTLAG